MSIKIINKPQSYTPVTVELTFETREQLAAFVYLYGNTNYIDGTTEENRYGVANHDFKQSINTTLDYSTWIYLQDVVNTTV